MKATMQSMMTTWSRASLATLGLCAVIGASGCHKDTGDKPAGLPPMAGAAQAARAATPSTSGAPPAAAAPGATPEPAPAGTFVHGGGEGAGAPEAERPPPPPGESISGEIVLPPAMRARVSDSDVIFLAARRAGGPAGPASMLAVQKLRADRFPIPFAISAQDAMIPGVPFAGKVNITVRVDKDGDAMTRKKGDVLGLASEVAVGTHHLKIVLDKLQEQDQTLGTI